jgi:hypothetical protein
VNCWFWPTASNGFAGAMEIDCRTGAVTATVKTVEPVAACRAALILVVPAFKPEASPVEFREATAADDDDQVASWLTSAVNPPGHVPVAMNCCWFPVEIVGFAGAIEIESTPAVVPVPVRLTAGGLAVVLSVMVRVPVRVPWVAGVNVTEIVQLFPAANVLGDSGHVVLCPKSLEVDTPKMVSGVVWTFFRVTFFAALVLVITWFEKLRVAGDKVTGAVPDPVN